MSLNFEKVTENLRNTPEIAKLLENQELLNNLQNSIDGKKLMNILNSASEDVLNQAMQQVMAGKTEEVKNTLSALFNSPDGAELIKRLSKLVKG